jgi:hypothetical protein
VDAAYIICCNVCVCVRARVSLCVYMCVCVCVCERERERERVYICIFCQSNFSKCVYGGGAKVGAASCRVSVEAMCPLSQMAPPGVLGFRV